MIKKLFVVLVVLGLMLVNAVLVWPLFSGEYDQNTASIGIAHVLNARFLAEWQGWNPYWYGGFPNHLIYPLLAPLTIAFIQKVLYFFSMAQVYRIVVAAAYVLTSATLFILIRYISGRNLAAFFGTLIYILMPSANYFLIPKMQGIGAALSFAPWQLSVISDYGEGPHIIALSLVPLAVVAYWRLLRQPTFYKLLLTAALMALVVSVNLFSAYALGYFLIGVFLAEAVLGESKNKFLVSLLLLPVIYGLVAYCYDLSMLSSLARSGYIHPENAFRLPPLTSLFLVLIIIGGPILFLFYEIFKKKPHLQNKLVLGLWLLIFLAIPYAFYQGLWFGSQPNRYMPELNMTAAIIAGILLARFSDILFRRLPGWSARVVGAVFVAVVVVGMVYLSRGYITDGWRIVLAHQDIRSTSEYKIAHWLENHINYQNGERAYLSGSPAFFLNEFARVPQVRGDEDNAQADPWWADIVYQVKAGSNGALAVGWLEALNVRFIVVDFGANTPYKDFDNPSKFEGLQEAVQMDGFRIMEIPGDKNIIQAVDLTKVEALAPFSHPVKPVLDETGLVNYLAAVSVPQPGVQIDFSYPYRTSPDSATVNVRGATEQTGILFKSTYDSGWRATVKGLGSEINAEISKVGPDLMLIKPHLGGDYRLDLSYHRPLVEYLGYVTTLTTLALLGFLVLKRGNFKLGKLEKVGGRDEEND